MVSWQTIQTLLLLFGPIFYTKAYTFYKSTRTHTPPHPLSKASARVLNILFLTALVSLASTYPYFQSENIFTATSSRLLQTPTDVLFTRLSNTRSLTPSDEILKSRLSTREGRLLYATYGPTPLIGCEWCSLDEPVTFLYYALPAISFPHILHTGVLGAVTSSIFPHGSIWRTHAAVVGMGLFLVEVYWIGVVASTGDYKHNLLVARTLQEVRWTHWDVGFYRGVLITFVDAVLGYVVFLTGTGRLSGGVGVEAVGFEKRLEGVARGVEGVASRLQAEVVLRQAVVMDKGLRRVVGGFWEKEQAAEEEVMGDEGVAEVRKRVLRERREVEGNAERMAEGMMKRFKMEKEERDKRRRWGSSAASPAAPETVNTRA